MINLVYSKKENPYIWFGIALITIITFFVGAHYVNYYPWIVIPITMIAIAKGIKILKKPKVPVIKLDDTGITILKEDGKSDLYLYNDIKEVHINSKLLNGYIKTKDNSKKIHLDTVAIDLEKQKEITEIIASKII